ncbi:Putative uridine kinase [Vanrija pseudolonga]|uniref:Uridine kinase n=1 Tax=Vanrija pseudolonga TaxID=143232 RepID=A0AAF0YGE6_9TREE|nr:Putative uridine kinase [Vanrija pseudolonga]
MSVDAIAQQLVRAAAEGSQRRVVVAVSGIPGSGKSTLAYPLAERVNALAGREVAICVGIDGWHYSQAELRGMENPSHLFARRGAHFTFDAESYASFVSALDTTPTLPFPTFSHADKDPVQHGGEVRPEHRVIIIEGLHAHLDVVPWSTAAARYDYTIWVDTPRAVARERIVRRHLREGVEDTPDAAARRADQSDMVNADTLLGNRLVPSIVVDLDAAESVVAPAVAAGAAVLFTAAAGITA